MPRAHRLQNRAARAPGAALGGLSDAGQRALPVRLVCPSGRRRHLGRSAAREMLRHRRRCDACFSSMPGSRQSAPVRLAALKFHISWTDRIPWSQGKTQVVWPIQLLLAKVCPENISEFSAFEMNSLSDRAGNYFVHAGN